ncbi:MAG: glycoside hydrolase [Myxococcales bacterium]|nr:glycoside hydrolase [Myxococcales bacterium]
MTRSTLLVSAFLFGACTGTGQEIEFTTDIRVDQASANEDPDSFGTQLCVTEAGVVYVLWLDNRLDLFGDKVDIWMNRSLSFGDDGTWLEAPVKVNQGDINKDGPGNVWNPDLHCNEQGVFVVWEDDRDGELQNHQIYFNRSTDNGETFLPDDILLEFDDDGTTMSLEPQITGFSQDLFVAWYDSANGAYDIFVTSSNDGGGTWRDTIRVDSDVPAGSAYSARPQVAMSDDAEFMWVAWEDARDGNADIYFTRSANGGVTFDDDTRLDGGFDEVDDPPGAADSFEPQLCTDNLSNVYVFWHDSRNSGNVGARDIYYNYSLNAGADFFFDSRRLDSDGRGLANSLYPVCAVDGNTAHVAWQDNRFEGYDIFYRMVEDGIPDLEEIRLDAGTAQGSSNSLDTIIDFHSGNVAVAWNDGRAEAESLAGNGYTDLYYNWMGGDTDWDTEDDYRIDSMFDGQSFKVDFNFQILGGQWYAAWTDGRAGTSDIYFQKFDLGVASNPPRLEDFQ